MVSKRTVTITVCALVCCAMLVAGAVDLSVHASLFASRPIKSFVPMVLSRNTVLRHPLAISAVASLPVESSSSSSSPSEECLMAENLSQSLLTSAGAVSAEAHRQIVAVASAFTARYCNSSILHGAAKVNNQCFRFGVKTTRFAECMGEQQAGRPYVTGQTFP